MTASNGNGHSDMFQITEWKSFYFDIWSISLSIESSIIPVKKKERFDQLIIVPEGMTARKIVEKMRECFDVYLWNADDSWLDQIESEREPKSTYGIRARDCQEADGEPSDQHSMTLRERLLYEFFYWWKYKKHLDMEKVTRCSGSRHAGDGAIPWVFWDARRERLTIFWFHPDWYGDSLRDRGVII